MTKKSKHYTEQSLSKHTHSRILSLYFLTFSPLPPSPFFHSVCRLQLKGAFISLHAESAARRLNYETQCERTEKILLFAIRNCLFFLSTCVTNYNQQNSLPHLKPNPSLYFTFTSHPPHPFPWSISTLFIILKKLPYFSWAFTLHFHLFITNFILVIPPTALTQSS